MKRIPLQHHSKLPRDKNWRAIDYDEKDMKEWMKAGGNCGFRLEGENLIIDIDTKHEDARGMTANEIEEMISVEFMCDLSKYAAVNTGSGGRHVYMSKPPELKIREKIEAFGGAVEFKTLGRQILTPGCIHPNGQPYKVTRKGPVDLPAPEDLLNAIERPIYIPSGEVPDVTIEELKSLFDQINPEDHRDYDDWRNLMFAAHDASQGSEEGLALFTDWSQKDPHYLGSENEISYFWQACHSGGGRTVRTIYREVLAAGGSMPRSDARTDFAQIISQTEFDNTYVPRWRMNKQDKIIPSAHNVREAMRVFGFSLAYDDFSHRIVDTRTGKELSDGVLYEIWLMISDEMGTRWMSDPSLATLQAAVQFQAMEQSYHPIREYLDELKWDGKSRLRTWMIDHCHVEPSAYAQEVSELMLRAAVARVYQPGIKYDIMVILEGPQGVGKSSLVRHLGGQWTLEGLPPLRGSQDKDVVDAMQGFWIIEVEELAATRKTEADQLKAFVSRTMDRVRLAYARNSQEFPRQCVFIGSTNDDTYLRDSTGNRRFAPIVILREINLKHIDRDQLWAEAVHVYKQNPNKPLTFPRQIWADAADEAEKRRAQDPWEEQVWAYCKKMSGQGWIASEDILNDACKVQPAHQRQSEVGRLGRVMKVLNIERSRRRPGKNEPPRRGYIMPKD